MIEIKKEIRIEAPVEAIYKALTSYRDYPKYMLGVQGVRVKKKIDKLHSFVVYNLLMFGKEVSYTLAMTEKPTTSLSWKLQESSFMKHNSGSWTLSRKGRSDTAVTYRLKLDLCFLIPPFLLKRGAQSQAKQLLSGFKHYCETGETL